MVLEFFSKATSVSEVKHYVPTVLVHSSLKGMKYGILGGFVLGVLISVYNRLSKKKKYISSKTIIKNMNSGMIVGVILLNGYYLIQIAKKTRLENKEFALNLQKETRQNNVDNIFIASMFVGEILLSIFQIEAYKNLKFVGGVLGGMLSLIFVDKYIDSKGVFNVRNK